MSIDSKWLRGLFAALMLCGVCMSAGCAETDSGESLEEVDAGSDDNIGAGGVETP